MEKFIDVFGLKKRKKLLCDELYVMLMLMRSEGGEGSASKADCDDEVISLACQLGTDACPAECREDAKDNEDEVVKSGDLAVSATAAEGKKALLGGGTSDLDTLTFKTSEEVEISSITLERYGYSTIDDVATVQLEDEDGNIIADAKELNNKGQVKLSIKKDYRKVDGTYKATIVLTTDANAKGSSIGFKVVDADSTAKNLNLDNYDPYLYDLVNYAGSAVEFSSRNSNTKDYNWEAGKLYEVAKFRVKAPADANILVKGFTLTDKLGKVDADKYADKVTVTVDGKEVDGLKWNINKSDELVVSFDEVEVEGKKTVTIAVNMSFNEEFDDFGESIQYNIKQLSNFNATDKKTGSRVSEDTVKKLSTVTWTAYKFNGGKIKLTGTKLGSVDAAQNATNVLVAQGEITVTETLRGTARIIVKANDNIDAIRLVIAGEEYDGTKVKTITWDSATDAAGGYKKGDLVYVPADQDIRQMIADGACNNTNSVSLGGISIYDFKGLEIEKSGKVEVRVDIKDNAAGTMEFAGSFNSSSFTELKYDESGDSSAKDQVVGSISFSNVKTQAAKASLENKNTKEVELVLGENNRKTIFDGTYTAKKGAVELTEFAIKTVSATQLLDKVTFYVTVDGEEYDLDFPASTALDTYVKGDLDRIAVDAGKSVNVKVEVEVVPTSANPTAPTETATYNLYIKGEDENSNDAGEADEDTVKVKVVKQGTVDVDSTAKNTVLLKSNRALAEFLVKPSKAGDDEITLDSLQFTYTNLTDAEIKVEVDDDVITVDGSNAGLYKPDVRVPSDGVKVKVSLKSEPATAKEAVLNLTEVNGNGDGATTWKKYYVPAILYITQRKTADLTYYSVEVEKDGSEVVKNVKLYAYTTDDACKTTTAADAINVAKCELVAFTTADEALSKKNEDVMSATNDKNAAKTIAVVTYDVTGVGTITVKKAVYGDFFKKANGSDDLMVYSNGN